MNYTKESKEMLERYLWNVKRKLPLGRRKDIMMEIKSTLFDMIDASAGDQQEITADKLSDVLKKMGSPDAIAAGYAKTEVVLPPQLVSIFKTVYSIVAAVLIITVGIGIIISYASGEGVHVLSSLLNLVSSLIHAFGMMVIIFLVIYRFNPSWQWETEKTKEPWDPAALPKVEYMNLPAKAESAAAILFSAALITLLNFYRELFGISTEIGAATVFVPALGDGFIALIPLLTARWCASILYHGVLLWKRAWATWLRFTRLVLTAADGVILLLFLQGSPDRYIRFDLLEQTAGFEPLAPMLRTLFSIVIILALVFTAYDLIKGVRLFFTKPILTLNMPD